MKKPINIIWIAIIGLMVGLIFAVPAITDQDFRANINRLVSDTAYDATSWDGVSLIAPSKNAVRDKVETLCLESVFGTAIGTGLTLDSTTLKVDIATDAETITGTSDSVVVTPGNLTARLAVDIILTKTDSYTITTADFGKTIRMNNAAAKIFTFPSVGADDDGALLYLENQGAGRLTLQMVDSDIVMDSAATGTCYTDDDNNATLVLRYNHALVTWQAVGGHGTWTTT